MEAAHEISLKLVVSEDKMFENVDGRRMSDVRTTDALLNYNVKAQVS